MWCSTSPWSIAKFLADISIVLWDALLLQAA